jgi:predicted RNA binding protein YcfA (HicA-like mRNA interferase family)
VRAELSQAKPAIHRPQTEYDSNTMPTRVKELLTLLEDDGWLCVRQKGSHRQYHHASKPGTVTVAGKPSIEVPPGTLNSILKQAGLKK